MKHRTLSRLERLEEIARAAQKARSKLLIDLGNTKITIKSVAANFDEEIEADTPLEAVEALEKYILKKMPEHVIMSYGFDDLFDLYPEMREAFADFTPVACANLTVGDYYKSMENLSLRHIILYNHVHTWGCDCMANREKGIIYTEEDFQRIFSSGVALFIALRDILDKEQYWREHSGQYRPDTKNVSYGNMRYGKSENGKREAMQ